MKNVKLVALVIGLLCASSMYAMRVRVGVSPEVIELVKLGKLANRVIDKAAFEDCLSKAKSGERPEEQRMACFFSALMHKYTVNNLSLKKEQLTSCYEAKNRFDSHYYVSVLNCLLEVDENAGEKVDKIGDF